MNKILRNYKLLLPIVFLALLTSLLFRHHIYLQDALWLGNSDRINSNLKILQFYTESISAGHLDAWNEHEMLGYDSFALPYTFPNIITYICSWLGLENLYINHGYISLILLTLAGISTYYFVLCFIPNALIAMVSAVCYQFSNLTLLKVSQNDMSFAVFILIPIMLLIVRKIQSKNSTLSFVMLSIIIFSMLFFMFLQKVSYALLLVGCYVLYRCIKNRTWLPFVVFSAAFITATIGAWPRIYGIYRAIGEYVRINIQENTLGKTLEQLYLIQGITPTQILRWFDDTIFGRFPSETSNINHMNMPEGFVLFTSTFVPFLLLYGLIRYRQQWLKLPRSSTNDTSFWFWFLVLCVGVVTIKPLAGLFFILYNRMDFTHARILIVALLPTVTLIALILYDLAPKASKIQSTAKNLLLTGAALILAWSLVWGIESLATQASGFSEFPKPIMYKVSSKAIVLNFLIMIGFFNHLFLLNEALVRIVLCAFLFIALITALKYTYKPHMKVFFFQILCFAIIIQTMVRSDFQINGQHTFESNAAFAKSNFYYAKRDEFLIPTSEDKQKLISQLDNTNYRSAILCDNTLANGYCAGHIPEFWSLRVVDGYYGIGVPKRLAALPWQGHIGLRHILFNSDSNNLPWSLLGFLNVKNILVADKPLYANTDRGVTQLQLLSNPEQIVPRGFFAPAIIPTEDFKSAAKIIFDNNQIKNVMLESTVEGITQAKKFSHDGSISFSGSGDNLAITVSPSNDERFLVINELYFPGWQARINGQQTKVYPTNVIGRGIIVPPGTTQVTMTYVPFVRSEVALLFYSGSCILLFAGIVILSLRNRRYSFVVKK